MGDTVVFQDEVTPAMDAAFAHRLEVTALHNHFFYDEPKVYFMHIGGKGDPEKLAKGVKDVWDAIKKVRTAAPQPAKPRGVAEVVVEIGHFVGRHQLAIEECAQALIDQGERLGDAFSVVLFGGLRHYGTIVPIPRDRSGSVA